MFVFSEVWKVRNFQLAYLEMEVGRMKGKPNSMSVQFNTIALSKTKQNKTKPPNPHSLSGSFSF